MADQNTYQFVRMAGYPRGPASKRGTLGSILAEGLRRPTHTSHLPGAPRFNVVRLDGPVEEAADLQLWIEDQMQRAKNPMTVRGKIVHRSVRSDATAIGSIITSLPETLDEFDPKRFSSFAEDTTEWARDYLAPFDMLLHFRLEHLDELHPHLHLWFTPKGVEIGDGSWTFLSVMGRSKGFLHKLQVDYFNAVGHKYADFRARPINERKARLPRHFAVQQRDADTLDIVRRIRAGDISALRDAESKQLPTELVGKLLNELDDRDIDSVPAVNRRLIALRSENEAKESKIKQLEAQLAELQATNSELSASLSQQSDNGQSTIERNALLEGAKGFVTEGVWQHIVQVVLRSAHRNMNRAFQVPPQAWEELVIEDALPEILPTGTSGDVAQIDYWLEQAARALKESSLHDITSSPFKPFSELFTGAAPAAEKPRGDALGIAASRFRKAAEKSRSDSPSPGPWAATRD